LKTIYYYPGVYTAHVHGEGAHPQELQRDIKLGVLLWLRLIVCFVRIFC